MIRRGEWGRERRKVRGMERLRESRGEGEDRVFEWKEVRWSAKGDPYI